MRPRLHVRSRWTFGSHFVSPTSPSSDGDMSAVPRWGLSRTAFDLLDNAKVITDVGAMSFVSFSTRLPVPGNH